MFTLFLQIRDAIYDALKADPARALSVGQVRAALATEHKKASKKA